MNRSIPFAKTCVSLVLLLFGATGATAGSLYFTGTNSVWDNGTTHDWATVSGGPYTSLWSGGSDAHFQGTAGIVTVSGSIASVNSLNFDVSGYALTGGSINLTGTSGPINVVSGGTATINSVLTGSTGVTLTGIGSLTLSSTTSSYSGPTSITMGTLIAGNNAFAGFQSAFGNATSAVTIGDANSNNMPAALVTGGPLSLGYGVEIDRDVTVNATAGPTTLGDITTGDASLPNNNGLVAGAAFAGVVTLNNTGTVTLSAANGGSVTFDTLGYGTITGTGTGGITVASAGNGNVTLSNTNSYHGPTVLASGQLTLNYGAMESANGSTVGGIIPPASPVTLGGGTLAINDNANFSVNETFVSTKIAGFGSTLVVNAPNALGVQVNLGTISRSGGALDLPSGIGGPVTYTTTSPNNSATASGILGGYLTVNGYADWAAGSGASPYTIGAPASYDTDNYSLPTNNVDVNNLTPPALSTAVATTVNSLRFNNTLSATSSGSLSLGGGTLTLASGGILVTPSSGTNGISNGTLTASGTMASNSLADVVVVQGNPSAPFTISAAITNNGSTSIGLTKAGPGTLILGGSNTFTGPITVAGGSLQGSIGAGSVPATTTSIAVNSGTSVTFMENGPSAVTTSILISGSGALTKAGSQTLTFSGGVPSGGLSVVGGTFNVGGSQVVDGPVFIGNGATLGMAGTPGLAVLSNDTIGDLSGSGVLNISGTIAENATTGSEFDGTITGFGLFLKSGPGTLILTNSASNLNGSVRIGQGKLQLNSPLALQTATLDMNAGDMGTLDTTTGGITSLTLGGLTGARNLAIAAIPLTIGGDGVSTTYTGNLSGATSLTKVGADSLFLGGANSYGSTIVSAGTLDAMLAASLPGAVNVANGASLVVQTGSGTTTGWSSSQLGNLFASGGFAAGSVLGVDTTNANATYSGNLTGGTLALTKLGPNAFTLSGSSINSGPINVTAGSMNFTSASPTIGGLSGGGNVVLGSAGANATNLTIISSVSSTYSGSISEAQGQSSLTKAGPGTLILSGSDMYSGGTMVLAGTFIATAPAALLDGSRLSVGNDLSAFPGAASAAASASTLSAVPEPETLLLLGVAGIVAAAAAWRRRRN